MFQDVSDEIAPAEIIEILDFDTVGLSFVFNNYCPIID